MKNKLLKFLPLLLIVLWTSCSQAPIFYDIAREIKLADANVPGDVYSIVKLGNTLYTQNSKIFSKGLKDERGWSSSSSPSGRVIKLASDDEYLYALTAEQTNNDDSGKEFEYKLWSSLNAAGDWKTIETKELSVDDEDDITGIVLFDNGVNEASGRKAYFRKGGIVYNLTSGVKGDAVTATSASASTVAAAKGSSGDYFSDSLAFCANGSKLYEVKDGVLKLSTNGTDWSDPLAIGTVNALTFGDGELYAATDSGIKIVSLDASGILTSVSSFGSNASLVFDDSKIISIATFGAADDNAIYAGAISATSSKNNAHALWGYYPSRGNWNYE